MKKVKNTKLISKIASKKTLKKNTEALKSYGFYRETSDLIDRADIALGRKPAFKVGASSTINFEINHHGIGSTTTQKV